MNLANPTSKPRPRLPKWLRLSLPTADTYSRTRRLLDDLQLHTVCESARCPNHWECWSQGAATFMIAGDRCTRACRFCAVQTTKPLPLDPEEPARVAEAVRRLRLKHVVITSVARDDLPDGGAGHYRRTIEAIRRQAPAVVIEVLTPDFNHSDEAIDTVLAAYPHIFNHNLETVRRLTPMVRSRATYDGSLQLLRVVKVKADSQLRTKSGLMLGLGETDDEVAMAMADLREAGCDSLTLGQYLQPTPWHLPVAEFIPPSKFEANAILARKMGFAHVTAGPLVRSSYHAEACGPFIA